MSGWLKKRRVMHRYDLTANMYDMRYAEEQEAKIEAAMKNVKAESLGVVLDVGCGTGVLFAHVAEKSEDVVGVDISRKTLVQAEELVHRGNLANVHLIQADADNMPFSNSVSNHVFAMTVLQNTPDASETLREIRRVGKDDSVLVITGLKKIFTKRRFERILARAKLKVETMEDGDLKCYVAVCKNSSC
jgi:demethylmenaquinone methyltransferase/2-methoxy-6-polyprenyl-1,4-benzoquinol methylase